ncbi:hypothetical protein [Roseitalea porphyridii]|uniref:F0F1 ATP synthase subunit B family protein n=1 Tax=Roseitalea porphyridii TaxID=1852022 RepID=UPI0032EE2334
MHIDWLTVTAQIVNFLILVWLLQRFLYRPITSAMARREARIEARLADAKSARQDAEDEAQAWRDKQRELDNRKSAIIEEVRREAESMRARLEEEIRAEMEERRGAWAEHLQEEREELAQALRKRMARHVHETTRRILANFADADLAGQVAREFGLRLEALGDNDRQRLAEAAAKTSDPALVESGVTLTAPVPARITRAIHEQIADGMEVDYRTAEDVLMGVRLTVGDQTLEWSASEYLDRVETLVAEELEMAGRGGRTKAQEPSRA